MRIAIAWQGERHPLAVPHAKRFPGRVSGGEAFATNVLAITEWGTLYENAAGQQARLAPGVP